MKQFSRLISTINTKGIGYVDSLGDTKTHIVSEYDLDVIEQCMPVVFSEKGELSNEEVDSLGVFDDAGLVGAAAPIIAAAPFKVFSYEMLTGPITPPREIFERNLSIWCVMCIEQIPGKFKFLILLDSNVGSAVLRTNSCGALTDELLKRFNTEAVGVESCRTSIKLGAGKIKRQIRIRRIVHVRPKSVARKYIAEGGVKINFSHRFFVRGHWRNLAQGKLGKDRTGDYCVTGHTWVTECEKGPESAPLIKKTRIVY